MLTIKLFEELIVYLFLWGSVYINHNMNYAVDTLVEFYSTRDKKFHPLVFLIAMYIFDLCFA